MIYHVDIFMIIRLLTSSIGVVGKIVVILEHHVAME